MTTDQAMGAYVRLSEVLMFLNDGQTVTLDKSDLDWLADIHLLLPELPLKTDTRGEA